MDAVAFCRERNAVRRGPFGTSKDEEHQGHQIWTGWAVTQTKQFSLSVSIPISRYAGGEHGCDTEYRGDLRHESV